MQLPPLNRIKGELFSLLLSHLGGESLPGKGLSVFSDGQSNNKHTPPTLPFFAYLKGEKGGKKKKKKVSVNILRGDILDFFFLKG